MSLDQRTMRRGEILLRSAMEMSLGTGDDYAGAAAEAQICIAAAMIGLAKLAKDPERAIAETIKLLQAARP